MKKASFSEAEAFLALANHRGFGAAALELGVTQSTMSRRIAALEKRIGQRLVARTTRRVALTDAGLSYAAELRDVLRRLESADARVQNRNTEPEGLLRVTMPKAFGRVCIVPHLTRLLLRYPKLRVELDLSDHYADILEGGFDVAIRLAALQQSGVNTQRLGSFNVHFCASPTHVKTHGLIKEPEDIATYDCLALWTYPPRVRRKAIWKGRDLKIELFPRLLVSDLLAMHRLVVDGVGAAILPSYLVDADLAAGRLVHVMPGLRLPGVDVFVAYPHGRETLAKVAVFLQEVKRIMPLVFRSSRVVTAPDLSTPMQR
jgi:DNA-binding transcriptional LysR family regulator